MSPPSRCNAYRNFSILGVAYLRKEKSIKPSHIPFASGILYLLAEQCPTASSVVDPGHSKSGWSQISRTLLESTNEPTTSVSCCDPVFRTGSTFKKPFPSFGTL